MKTKKSTKIPKKDPTISTITPSYNRSFQTWNINVIAAPVTSTQQRNIPRSASLTIGIYEIPTIRSFNVEYKYAPYYYLGYGFYGNPYDKNGRECNQKPVLTVNKMVNIYDRIAISLNTEESEICIWYNGVIDDSQEPIKIESHKEYQFIIESLDKNYHISTH
eukprot:UN01457